MHEKKRTGMGEGRLSGRGFTRREFLTLGAGAGLLFLAGCGGGAAGNEAIVERSAAAGGTGYDGPSVQLSFWNGFTGGDGPVMRKLVERFNSEHENVEIAMNVMQWNPDFYQKAPAAIATGKGPDVAIMQADHLATNAARGVVVQLDGVAEALGLAEGDFSSVPWQAGIYEGRRYGIPLDVHPLGLYYNKKVMREAGLDSENPPQTRDDYEAALKELRGQGIQGSWVSPFIFTGWQMYQSLLWQFGGDLYNEDTTRAAVDSEGGVEALKWMVGLVKGGDSPENLGQDADWIAFKNNQTAFNWNGIWQINDLAAAPELEWGLAPLPRIGTEKAAWANSHNFVIPNQAQPDENKLQASKAFIAWVLQRSMEWAKAGQVPAQTSSQESSEFRDLEWQPELAKEVPYLHLSPTLPGVEDVQDILFTAVNNAVLLRQEPESALKEAASRATQLLERNREKYGG